MVDMNPFVFLAPLLLFLLPWRDFALIFSELMVVVYSFFIPREAVSSALHKEGMYAIGFSALSLLQFTIPSTGLVVIPLFCLVVMVAGIMLWINGDNKDTDSSPLVISSTFGIVSAAGLSAYIEYLLGTRPLWFDPYWFIPWARWICIAGAVSALIVRERIRM
jgi:hypothetical protein